ncbi:MAG: DUF2461 domain-containing protein [Flavobacteriales bacterium]|nr:DUF2461 domain-containing protein [Flavobacteriales bacterium]
MSRTVRIERTTLDFLVDLNMNNDREWFQANKGRYTVAKENMEAFADALIKRMVKHDRISTATGRQSLMRIHADQRFHKDRPPYRVRFAGVLGRHKPELRGGYFFSIQPGKSMVACGFFGPEPGDLRRIRANIAQDHATWKKLLGAEAIRTNFGKVEGEQLRTAPRDHSKDHPAIELLRHKQFILRHRFSDKDVLAPVFLETVERLFKSVRPWFDHMSEVLTTDENGISMLRNRS